jgi:hypothetical protein
MNWQRSGRVWAAEPYVIEPHAENLGVVTYRLTGGGLYELHRSVDRLKEWAEEHARRQSAEARDQRRYEADQARRGAGVEALWAGITGRRRAATYPATLCPGCKADLNADARNFVEDTDLVRFRCRACGTASAWDFDPPVPILVVA